MVALIVIAVLVVFALIVAARTVRVIPQARAGVVERSVANRSSSLV